MNPTTLAQFRRHLNYNPRREIPPATLALLVGYLERCWEAEMACNEEWPS